ncbi:Deoxycytidine monophosphate (dCMP) deaminase [Thoreauomyces humboldtii]|nr:Deoxycytidine monophosphate (dCMP) deaminase [Thoreauomyces humboldtii]
MLIALVGPSCAGKGSVADYLTTSHGFQTVALEPANAEHHPKYSFTSTVASTKQSRLTFPTIEDLVTHVTTNWSKDYVLSTLRTATQWEPLSKRPFCLLVAVDAPMTVRFRRSQTVESMEDFVRRDDQETYGETFDHLLAVGASDGLVGHRGGPAGPPEPSHARRVASLHALMQKADVRIFNPYASRDDLYAVLRAARLTDVERLRPSWDSYFMQLCNLAARRSNCMKRRVGCILVKERRIIATGYNGTPRGIRNCSEGGCPRCNGNAPCGSGLDVCLCLHAEENALLEAGRERVDSGGDTILYCNTCPCLGCAKKIVQVGVKEVVYSLAYGMDDATARLFSEAGIKLRQHLPLESSIEMSLLAAERELDGIHPSR